MSFKVKIKALKEPLDYEDGDQFKVNKRKNTCEFFPSLKNAANNPIKNRILAGEISGLISPPNWKTILKEQSPMTFKNHPQYFFISYYKPNKK